MRLPIEQVDPEGRELVLECEAREFPVLEEIRQQGEAAFEGPIRFDVRAARMEAVIHVRGGFSARVRLRCSRCLAGFCADLSGRFALTYCPRSQMPEQRRPGEETELSLDEVDLISFEGEEIDLREGLQEHLVMALPVKPLCSRDCRGICPECGADRNRNPCRCGHDRVDPRLAVLGKLKDK